MTSKRATRPLSRDEKSWVRRARDKADDLYAGIVTPHRSCGIALAETFGLETRSYQSLRRGGITGEGVCGAIRAGEQILGEILGDPEPTAAVTDDLREAMYWYRSEFPSRVHRGRSPDYVCNHLTAQHDEFRGEDRMAHCTRIAREVAELTAEALVRFGPGMAIEITPVGEAEQ